MAVLADQLLQFIRVAVAAVLVQQDKQHNQQLVVRVETELLLLYMEFHIIGLEAVEGERNKHQVQAEMVDLVVVVVDAFIPQEH
jgi:ATP-dependent protease Clp ATPase subunit